MAFVVETGQGLEDANSYASVSDLKDFCSLRGISLDGKTDSDLEGALVKSTDWIDANYGAGLLGVQAFGQQALLFPRSGVVNPATGSQYELGYMPPRLKKAVCLLAVEALSGKLWRPVSGAAPQVIEDTIGPITTKYAAQDPSILNAEPNFTEVRQTMGPLMRGLSSLTVSR